MRYVIDDAPAGNQLVIPGAEKSSTAEYGARLVDLLLTTRRVQVGLRGTGLFGVQLK